VKGEQPAPASADRRPGWLPLALLIGLTAIAYLPSLANGFVWDDDISLTQNPYIRSGAGLRQFWLTTQTPDYWPVTATTLWAEWRLWGMNPLGYHVTNLSLHIAEALLLWTVLRRLRLPGAWLAALLFALHPVNVESVAWITQRKNLMAMLFYLLSVFWILRTRWYDGGVGTTRATSEPEPFYWLSLIAFALAMLSKGSVAVLPVILLGMIAWRRRIELRDLIGLLPFFFVAGGLTLVDVWFQGHHLAATETIRTAGAVERLLGAGAVVGFYLYKVLLPIHLTLPYPLWRIEPGRLVWWLPLLAAMGLTGLLWFGARRHPRTARLRSLDASYAVAISASRSDGRNWWRAALFAWGYFCVALIPVMGFTDVYFMKFSLVADHYQHLAIIGVTALAGAGWAEWRCRVRGSGPLALAALMACVLGGLTWRQCLRYRDAETFFVAAVREAPGSAMAQGNLGMILGGQQRLPEAMTHLEEALRLDPGYAEAHTNLGALLVGQGRIAEGEAHYRAAVRLKPDLFVAHLNLGSILLHQGRLAEARSELQEAVRLKPSFAEAHGMLGDVFLRLDRLPEAVGEYEAALRLKPDLPAVRAQLERAKGSGR